MSKKILIIGAGMAGLSAGVHALRNGYEAEIFEMHHLPGGLCTAWQRNGYTFDGCIHWLVGTKPGSQFNRLWREVGALKDIEVVDHDIFMSIEAGEGKTLHIYSDLERLREHLLEHSPEDKPVIDKMINGAKALSGVSFPLEKPEEISKIWDMPAMLVKMLPLFGVFGKFSRISIAGYLKQLKNPFLKEALAQVMPIGYSMLSLLSTLASQHDRDAGFPQGGSLAFARSIEKRFLELGGKINYRSRVTRILIENNRATGVLLEDGSDIKGDLVISAADLRTTAYELLRKKYLTPKIKKSFSHFPVYSSVQISLGIAADLSGEAEKLAVKLNDPPDLGLGKHEYLYLTNYSFDPTLAPPGKTMVSATLLSSYDYWEPLAADKDNYRAEKEKLAELAKNAVEKRFPSAAGKIEKVDVATPLTYHRYTGVWKGAYMAWIVPPDEGRFKLPKQLPGLEGFYQVGQWIEPPAGLPGSMLTGRHVIQIICDRDKKPFRVGEMQGRFPVS